MTTALPEKMVHAGKKSVVKIKKKCRTAWSNINDRAFSGKY